MHLPGTPCYVVAAVRALVHVPLKYLPSDGFDNDRAQHIRAAERAPGKHCLLPVLEDSYGQLIVADFSPAHSWHESPFKYPA
jgi:hypothetical protein